MKCSPLSFNDIGTIYFENVSRYVAVVANLSRPPSCKKSIRKTFSEVSC